VVGQYAETKAGRKSRTLTEGERATRDLGAGIPLNGRRALPEFSVRIDDTRRELPEIGPSLKRQRK